MPELAVVCRDLSFGYHKTGKVLQDLNLVIPEGQVVGLLGPNGAGKTTLVRLMVGLTRPDGGIVRLYGRDPFREPEVRGWVGVMHQNAGFESFLSGWDNLYLYGKFLGLSPREVRLRIGALEEWFGPMSYLNREVITLSGGQRRRLQLVRALLHKPRLLFLDEPTVALDVEGRQQFYRAISGLVSELNTTVVWTSHYLDEIERNCRRVVILLGGELVLDRATEALAEATKFEIFTINIKPGSAIPPQVSGLEQAGSDQLVYRGHAEVFYREVLPHLTSAGIAIRSVHQTKPSLEEVYLRVVRAGEVLRT